MLWYNFYMTLYEHDDGIEWLGRTSLRDGIRYFNYTLSGFCFCLKGTRATCTIRSNPADWNDENKGVIGVFVTELPENNTSACTDGFFWKDFPPEPQKRIVLTEESQDCLLFESTTVRNVLVRVLKLSELPFGQAGFEKLDVDGTVTTSAGLKLFNEDALKLEFIGDSITCGYGIDAPDETCHFSTWTERPEKAYAFLAARELGARFSMISFSGIGFTSQYVPEDVDIPLTETLMQDIWPYEDRKLHLSRREKPALYDSGSWKPDAVIVNIGTNDDSWCRGNPVREAVYTSAYRQFLERVHAFYPSAKIICSIGIMGQRLYGALEKAVELFNRDFPAEGPVAVPFLFPDQNPAENGYGADYHPSATTQKLESELLASFLGKLFSKN